MSQYRVRSTGEVKSQGQLRRENANMSLPKSWGVNVHKALGIDPVLSSSRPDPSGPYKNVERDGVTQDSDGNWVFAWKEIDMFTEYSAHVDVDGNEVPGPGHDDYAQTVTYTVADQQAAYQTQLDAQAADEVRATRDALLAETDFHALSDTTMLSDMAAYRQALRDITAHANFPHDMEESDWPVKP